MNTFSNGNFQDNSEKNIIPVKSKGKVPDFSVWNDELDRLNKEEVILSKKIKEITIKFRELQIKRKPCNKEKLPSCDKRQKELEKSLIYLDSLLNYRKKPFL